MAAGIVGNIVEGVLFTYILVDSLELSRNFGHSVDFSGVLLGVHKMGTAAGAFCLWCTMQWNPRCWQKGRALTAGAVCIQVGAGLLFACFAHTRTDAALGNERVVQILLLARFASGLAGGVLIFLTLTLFSKLSPQRSLPAWNVKFFLFGISALGVGPLAAACARKLANMMGTPSMDTLSVVLWGLPVIPLIQVVCLAHYPDLDEVDDFSQQAKQQQQQQGNSLMQRLAVVCLLLMMLVRNLSVSMLEAGVSLILQEAYSWSSASSGMAMAVVISSVMVANPLYVMFAEHRPPPQVQRFVTVGLLMGSLGILSWQRPDALLGSATLCFVTSALSGGLIIAMLQQIAPPDGACLNLSTSMLIAVVGCDFLGRGCGPIIARMTVHRGGQLGLAVVQVGISILLLGFNEAGQCCIKQGVRT